MTACVMLTNMMCYEPYDSIFFFTYIFTTLSLSSAMYVDVAKKLMCCNAIPTQRHDFWYVCDIHGYVVLCRICQAYCKVDIDTVMIVR